MDRLMGLDLLCFFMRYVVLYTELIHPMMLHVYRGTFILVDTT